MGLSLVQLAKRHHLELEALFHRVNERAVVRIDGRGRARGLDAPRRELEVLLLLVRLELVEETHPRRNLSFEHAIVIDHLRAQLIPHLHVRGVELQDAL